MRDIKKGFIQERESEVDFKGLTGLPHIAFQQPPSFAQPTTLMHFGEAIFTEGSNYVFGETVDLTQGPDGFRGPPGWIGVIGDQGPGEGPGSQGLPGPPGPEGDSGTIGTIGAAGPKGLQGEQGPASVETGSVGTMGTGGETGSTGPRGPYKFYTGPVGFKGIRGSTGDRGPTKDDIPCDCCIGATDTWIKFPDPLIPPPVATGTNITGSSLVGYLYYEHSGVKYLIDIIHNSPVSTDSALGQNLFTDFNSAECQALNSLNQGITYFPGNEPSTIVPLAGDGVCACSDCETMRQWSVDNNDVDITQGEYPPNSAGIYIVEDLLYTSSWNELYTSNTWLGCAEASCTDCMDGWLPGPYCNTNQEWIGFPTRDCENICWPEEVISHYLDDGECCYDGGPCKPLDTIVGGIPTAWQSIRNGSGDLVWGSTGAIEDDLDRIHGVGVRHSVNLNCTKHRCDGNIYPAGHASSTQDCGPEGQYPCNKDDDDCCPEIYLTNWYGIAKYNSAMCVDEDFDLHPHEISQARIFEEYSYYNHPRYFNGHWGNTGHFDGFGYTPPNPFLYDRIQRVFGSSYAYDYAIPKDTYPIRTKVGVWPNSVSDDTIGSGTRSGVSGFPFPLVMKGKELCIRFRAWLAGTGYRTYSSPPAGLDLSSVEVANIGIVQLTAWNELKRVNPGGWPNVDPWPDLATGASFHNKNQSPGLVTYGWPAGLFDNSAPWDMIAQNGVDVFYPVHWLDGVHNSSTSAWCGGCVQYDDGTIHGVNPADGTSFGSFLITERLKALFPNTSRDLMAFWIVNFGTGGFPGNVITFTDYEIDSCCTP